MRVKFNGNEYVKRGRNGMALKDLCFDIFKKYINENPTLNYRALQTTFNEWHCNNRKVLLTEDEWNNQTLDGKSRYFSPIEHNGVKLYFTTQWGNNGGECDNINRVIEFAKEQDYDIHIIEQNTQNNIQKRDIEQNIENNSTTTKNIILYGSPGVGKTYNHKKLISLIESKKNQKDIFDAIRKNDLAYDKSIFETVKKENRFKFVTFHQSYSYEDFIEGFRPNEDGSIKLEDGIFKEIAEKASKNLTQSSTTKYVLDFENILEQFQIDCEIGTILKTVQGKEFEILDYTSKSIRIKVNDNRYSISYAPLKKIFLENKNSKIERPLDIVHALDGSFKGLSTYYYSIFKKLLKYEVQEIQTQPQKNYYLIIDEINRGNISKIFGELITLIEDDKRDEIEVTLPYSKESFKVPSNLYIIATMNSTDKSIALIDIALRRRFTFIKIKPDASLVDSEALDIFTVLNDLITSKLGEDYQIGHSYFMDCDLDFVLEYKIKPLLEEYFYSDEEGLKEALEIIGYSF